eukprot:COSAG02_NODE_7477_length_2995_cov_1.468577_1_plen_324_part_00
MERDRERSSRGSRDRGRERDRDRERDRSRSTDRSRDRDYDSFADADAAESGSERKRQRTQEATPADPGQWVYLDQQGAQQGPFSTDEMRGWYTGGFFQGSLQVRPAAAAGEFAPLLSFSWLSGGDSSGTVGGGAGVQDSGGAKSVGDDISATTGEGVARTQRAPLSSQESLFGASQVAEIAAGGSAQSARGQALFLQERLRQFEQQQGQGQSDDGAVGAGQSTAVPMGASTTAPESGGTVSSAPGATASTIDKRAAGTGRGRGKGKSSVGGGGGFLGMLKKQVKQTEKAQQRGISTDNLSLDATEKQGQNHGVFKYLLPPMGH